MSLFKAAPKDVKALARHCRVHYGSKREEIIKSEKKLTKKKNKARKAKNKAFLNIHDNDVKALKEAYEIIDKEIKLNMEKFHVSQLDGDGTNGEPQGFPILSSGDRDEVVKKKTLSTSAPIMKNPPRLYPKYRINQTGKRTFFIEELIVETKIKGIWFWEKKENVFTYKTIFSTKCKSLNKAQQAIKDLGKYPIIHEVE